MILRNFIFILFASINLFIFSQDKNTIVGEWRVLSIDNGEVYLNAKTDSVSTTAEFDRKHSTKVSHQDGIAEIRAFSSHNEFIFNNGGGFQLYLDHRRNKNTLRLNGTYEFINDSKLNLKVKGRTKREMEKEMELEFIDDLLLIKFKYIAMRGNKPTEYLLERIK